MRVLLLLIMLACVTGTCASCLSSSQRHPSYQPSESSAVLSASRVHHLTVRCANGGGGGGSAVDIGGGYMVTARHAIYEGACFYLSDGELVKPVAVSPTDDIAILSTRYASSPVVLAEPEYGASVLVIGYPNFHGAQAFSMRSGLIDSSVAEGAVEGVGITRMYRIRSRIAKGSSGGGVFSAHGALVGVVVAGGGEMAYAVPVAALRELLAAAGIQR